LIQRVIQAYWGNSIVSAQLGRAQLKNRISAGDGVECGPGLEAEA